MTVTRQFLLLLLSLSLLLSSVAAPLQLSIPPHDKDDPITVSDGFVWRPQNPASSRARLGTPTSSVADDPVQGTPTGQAKGLLAYTYHVYKAPTLFNYAVVVDTRTNAKTVYPIETIENNWVYDPQFSPDGSNLLLKVGHEEGEFPRYRLYVLNLHAQRLKKIPSGELSYHSTAWSPDSQSVAFVEGGSAFGDEDEGGSPIRLMVCQWQQGVTRPIVQNKGVVGGFCFASPDTLLYTALPSPEQEEKAGLPKATTSSKVPQPNIYEVKGTGTPRLVVRFGHFPVVSPDGKRIAFFGAENVERPSTINKWWWAFSQGSSLCVIDRDGTGRKALNLQHGNYSQLLWPSQPDRLLSVDQMQPSPIKQFLIKEWDLGSGRWKALGTLKAQDFEAVDTSLKPGIFALQPPDKKGSIVFYSKEITGLDKVENEYVFLCSIESFNIATGVTTAIALIKGPPEVDWVSLPSVR